MYHESLGTRKKLEVLLLASEWGSLKGGLSTMNRKIALYLAKHPEVAVSFLVPKCSEEGKRRAGNHNVAVIETQRRPGYEPIDCLSFPPRDLVIDIIIGHGVRLGKQAQVNRETHQCTWVQVVHTAPEELAMYKTYPDAIAKGAEKHLTEVALCEMADLVVAVGPKLCEVYSACLNSSGKTVFNLTPGIFTEFSDLKQSTQGGTKFRVLVFGRGDSEDFELKGFDIAPQAVAALSDRSYHVIFVGAPSGREGQLTEKLLEQGLHRSQLTVRKYLENRENLAKLFCEANLAIIPSRTEGFGLTALEALSACLPFLVSQNPRFGEALAKVPNGSSCVVDSEDPQDWAKAIRNVRLKKSQTRLEECQAVRRHYDEMYSWNKQCNNLVEQMISIVHDRYLTGLSVYF